MKQTPSKPADATETAKNEAIATYTSYWREMERSYAKGSSKGTSLKNYAAGSALAGANTGMENMLKSGQVTVGQVTVGTPTVTQIDIHRKIPNVRLSSCLDVSRWEVVDRDTRKPVVLPSERLTKYVVASVVEKWPAGWKVIRDEPQEKSC
ncbi:secreted protein/lipoprotein [Streptomyces sp. NPDC051644]|uniref:secreted protein/lipoprotein n=1 Tax=Streptomyces sp. NPDC051644 TaxID=3365666 RepID=UPI00378D1562